MELFVDILLLLIMQWIA